MTWREEKYFNLANNCLNVAENYTDNYNVLWFEGSQDNYYSYNSNYFTNTIVNLVRPKSNWFISVNTFGSGNRNRLNKIEDIIYLTNNYNNIYVGALLDSECIYTPPFNQGETEIVVDLWYDAINRRDQPYFVNNIYYYCETWFAWNDFFLIFGALIILIFVCLGCYYSIKYHDRRRYYLQIQENDS